MPKRGENIYHRKDGRWEGRYKNGINMNGKTVYSSVYGRSYTDVKEKLNKKKASAVPAALSCRLLFSEIAYTWLSGKRNTVKESSICNYEIKLNKYIIPAFGNIQYNKLSSEKIEAFIKSLTAKKLSKGYVSDIFFVVKSICRFAHKNYGANNICENIEAPKREKKSEYTMLTKPQTDTLVNALTASDDLTSSGILLALSTGVRIGELCALKWSNVDLSEKTITIKNTVQRIRSDDTKKKTRLNISSPKSHTSERTIPIPSFLIPILSKHTAAADLYLLSGNSKIVEPRTLQYRFKSILNKNNLPSVRFHSLRHAFATGCIASGADIKTVSELLGHSSVNITLDLYVHSSMQRKFKCMELFEKSIITA